VTRTVTSTSCPAVGEVVVAVTLTRRSAGENPFESPPPPPPQALISTAINNEETMLTIFLKFMGPLRKALAAFEILAFEYMLNMTSAPVGGIDCENARRHEDE